MRNKKNIRNTTRGALARGSARMARAPLGILENLFVLKTVKIESKFRNQYSKLIFV